MRAHAQTSTPMASLPPRCRIHGTPLTWDLANVLCCLKCRHAVQQAHLVTPASARLLVDLEIAAGPQEAV